MQVKQAFCLTGALNLFHFPLRLTPVMRFFFQFRFNSKTESCGTRVYKEFDFNFLR